MVRGLLTLIYSPHNPSIDNYNYTLSNLCHMQHTFSLEDVQKTQLKYPKILDEVLR